MNMKTKKKNLSLEVIHKVNRMLITYFLLSSSSSISRIRISSAIVSILVSFLCSSISCTALRCSNIFLRLFSFDNCSILSRSANICNCFSQNNFSSFSSRLFRRFWSINCCSNIKRASIRCLNWNSNFLRICSSIFSFSSNAHSSCSKCSRSFLRSCENC